MKYIAILRQDGEGCDYTIGCGINTIEFEANDALEAGLKLKEIVRENYNNSERKLKSAKWYSAFETENLKRVMEEQTRKELLELERLQQKYGKR
jgi:phosphoenolpyruvate carboxylase